MSRANLKRLNRVRSPSTGRDTAEQTKSKIQEVSSLEDSEDHKESMTISDENDPTSLRGKRILCTGRSKSATTLIMEGKQKSLVVEKLKMENSELNASIKLIQNRLSRHQDCMNEHSNEFTFVDHTVPNPNLLYDNEETQQDLLDFSSSPTNLQFQQKLSEQETFSKNILPKKTIKTPISLRCFKPDYTQTENVTEYIPATKNTENDLQKVLVDAEDLVQISLKTVQFLHHPLYSLEHLFATKLKEIYQNYTKLEFAECKTVKEVKKLQKVLLKQSKLQEKILKIWSGIKKLRREQQYSNTTLRLVITSKNTTFRQYFEELVQIDVEDSLNLEDPVLDLRLIETEEKKVEILDESESLRRKVVNSTKFTMKILCDGVLVAKSDPAYLSDNFELDFCQSFAIRLCRPPQWFAVELYEHPKGLLKKKIADFKIDLPNKERHNKETEWQESQFERREIVHYKHAGIGSGLTANEINELTKKCDGLNVNGPVYTRGILTYKIVWENTFSKDSSDENDHVYTKLRQVADRWGCLDKSALKRLLDGGQHQEDLIHFGLNIPTRNEDDVDYFRLSPNLDGKVAFCGPDDLNRNIRLKYLKLRDQHEIEFAHITIPNRVREIPLSIFQDFEQRKSLERKACSQTAKKTDTKQGSDDDNEDVETSRANKQRRLKRFYASVFRVCEGLEDNMTYESVVDEKYLIYFEDVLKTCLKNALNWFRWRPKVTEPFPRLAEPRVSTNQQPSCKVHVKILEVKNFPLRKEEEEEEEVRPVIEVCYDNWRTKVPIGDCRGRSDIVVEFPLRHSQVNYTNPDSFSGTIDINVLDDVSTDNAKRHVWLGSVKVPIPALISTYHLSGWFVVETPPLITGYRSCQNAVKLTNQKPDIPVKMDPYLRLELKITPSLPLIEPNMANLPSNDPPYMRDHVLKWNEKFNSAFPNRKFNALALDTRGRSSCITRYLRPLGPPQLGFNDDFDVSAEQCLRYVSLIPFTDSQRFYNNLWLTSDELLEFSLGSVVDHCVTLVCFLLALKLEAFLILGYGIPNGFTSYVLLMKRSVYHLLDVTYNRIYDLNDPFCPLQKVFCVVGPENVWGNIQRSSNLQLVRFDLNRRSDWWPLFDVGKVAPSANIVAHYDSAGASGEHLEMFLEQKLKRKFCKWRPTVKTCFNQRLINKLWCKEHLKNLEAKSNLGTLEEINKTLCDSNVQGTIIHSAFSSSHSLIKQVKRVEMHVQPQNVTEFILDVFVQPYPFSVFSVWILIGALRRKI